MSENTTYRLDLTAEQRDQLISVLGMALVDALRDDLDCAQRTGTPADADLKLDIDAWKELEAFLMEAKPVEQLPLEAQAGTVAPSGMYRADRRSEMDECHYVAAARQSVCIVGQEAITSFPTEPVVEPIKGGRFVQAWVFVPDEQAERCATLRRMREHAKNLTDQSDNGHRFDAPPGSRWITEYDEHGFFVRNHPLEPRPVEQPELEDQPNARHLAVEHCYSICADGHVELPDGKTWADVEDWGITWGTFHYKLRGEDAWRLKELDDLDPSTIDQKRPSKAAIYLAAEDGEILSVHPLARG